MPYETLVQEAHTMIDALPHEEMEYVVELLKNACATHHTNNHDKRTIPSRRFGALKDIPFKMSDDFDAPLDDFAEYM